METTLELESLHISEDDAETIANEAPEVNDKILGIYKQKVKFEEGMEINRFLKTIETYSYANGVTSDSNMIAIAVAALNNTDEGSLACGLVSDCDYSDWETFKTKISTILGHSAEHYRNKFNNFKRGQMRLGIALSTLTQSFKRGWKITHDLTETEENMIKTQFIRSLNNPLKLLLKAEETKLTLETILDRAIQLESCFDDETSQTVNMVHNSPEVPDKLTDVLNALQLQHKEMIEIQKKHSDALSKLQSGHFSRQFFESRPHVQHRNQTMGSQRTYAILNGLCSYYVRNQPCANKNCRYRHFGNITQEQRKLFAPK